MTDPSASSPLNTSPATSVTSAPATDENDAHLHVAPPTTDRPIVHLLIGREAGGITSAIGQWIPAQMQAGWRHLALLLSPGAADAELKKFGVETRVAGGGRGLSTRERITKLRHELSAIQPAIVHAHNPAGQFYAAIARRRVGYQVVRTVHADWTLEMKHGLSAPSRALWTVLTAIAMRRTDGIICIHDHIRRRLPQALAQRAVVIANGIDAARIERSTASLPEDLVAWIGSNDNVPVVAGIGRWVAIKRWDWLIRAWSRSEARKSTKLVIVGAGPEASRLRRLIDEIGVADSVRLQTWMPDLAPLLKRASLVVITSRSETGPLVILESMAASIPALTTRVGMTEDAVVEGETGWFIPDPAEADARGETDADSLAQRLDEALRDPERLRKMGESARRRLTARYDCRAAASARADFYNNLLRPDRATGNV